jgi:hypothetical protein
VKKTPPATLNLDQLSREEKKATLAAWVAELNVSRDAQSSDAIERWLVRVLDEFDAQQKGAVEEEELRQSFNAWLETAGESGGPEQEQDPARPHPTAWHGNRPDSNGESQD